MYKPGRAKKGSKVAALATATGVVLLLFALVPLVNQMNRLGRAGTSGRGVVRTAEVAPREKPVESSISTRDDRIKLSDRSKVPTGWSQSKATARSLQPKRKIEMPILDTFEPVEKMEAELVFNVEDLDNAPTPFFRKPPDYPDSMRRQAIEGHVVAEFKVDRDGKTMDVVIISSNHSDFSASVVEALLRWRFLPGKVQGRSVEFKMRIPMVFRIVSADRDDDNLMFAVRD